MNEIIREKGMALDGVDQEIKVQLKHLRRYPDLIIWISRAREEIAAIIELKQPFVDAYDDQLVQDAALKATELGSNFFATWNINKLILWETFRPGTRLIDRRLKSWDVVEVKTVEDLLRPETERKVKEIIALFLLSLVSYLRLKSQAPAQPVLPSLRPDEILAMRLKGAVDTLYIPFSNRIVDEKNRNPAFLKELREWFARQAWVFTGVDEDFDRASRQAVYLLINKILLYNVLRTKYGLSRIDVSNATSGDDLKRKLQQSFDLGTRLGFGVIFASDFVEKIPIPDQGVLEISKVVEELERYDFSQIGYDVVGGIFEKLTPRLERHKLGQYFTNGDVVDLMLGFVVKKGTASILDPACGSGTFLLRAYFRKEYLDSKLSHGMLLDQLWGVDISKFPAHLAVMNLLARDLSIVKRPNVAARDFFELEPGTEIELFEIAEEARELVKAAEVRVKVPSSFDAVVTNPPYTRQEEIEDLLQEGYKKKIGRRVDSIGIQLGKRSSIFSYFFFWGSLFLEKGGRMALITSNTWLDADFGKYLQELFLRDFWIVAIIEPRQERWFADADVATCITILEKKDQSQRNNRVKFVQIKKDLDQLLNSEQCTKSEEVRWKTVDGIVNSIESTDGYFEDERLRIFPKDQAELFDEGFDEEKGKYVGAKWGKYIRAPEIFFKILARGSQLDFWIRLKKLCTMRRGYTTGANEFFYPDKEVVDEWKIETRFLSPLVKSPRHHNRLIITGEDLHAKVLKVSKPKDKLKNTNVLDYIRWGEGKHYHLRETCASRVRNGRPWYALETRQIAPILFPANLFSRYLVFLNRSGASPDKRLYEVHPRRGISVKLLSAILNSTVYSLLALLYGRSPGGGRSVEVTVYEAASLPVLDPNKIPSQKRKLILNKFAPLLKREVHDVFNETEEEDRRDLDRVIFDLLGFTSREIEETYSAIHEIVRIQIARDKMKARTKKAKVDPTQVTNHIVELLKARPKGFPNEYLASGTPIASFGVKQKPAFVELLTDVSKGYSVTADDKVVYSGWDADRARFIYRALQAGNMTFGIPTNPKTIHEILAKYESDLREAMNKATMLLNDLVSDRKTREKVIPLLMYELTRPSHE
jgi:type I restriction enzyme M protein